MASEDRFHTARRWCSWRRPGLAWGLVALVALGGLPAQAQGTRSASGIYTCVDAQGRKLTSDRPIAECVAREQRVLNQDGSVRRVVPPTMSAEERAERDAQERRLALQRQAQADAVRRDRNMVVRYPDEATHQKARVAALETVRQAIKTTEQRLGALSAERRKLNDEAEFYNGRPLPAYLKQQIDANDAAVEAQRNATKNQEAELARVSALYDAELERLRRLWAGAPLGTLPPPVAATAPSAAGGKPASAVAGGERSR